MLDTILQALQWLFNLWNGLPEDTRDKVKKEVVAKFEPLFREFFHSASSEEGAS